MQHYSAIKKEWRNALYSNMDEPADYFPNGRNSDGEKQISYDVTYLNLGRKKKVVQINLFSKQKKTHRLRGWIYGF